MALPAPGNSISASQINVEATRSATANAPLSGSSSTPQTGSLVKIYVDSGVNQSAPHAYSEFYSKSFSNTTPVSLYFGNSPANACWYSGSLNSYFASNPTLGSGANTRIFTDAAGNNPVTQAGAYVTAVNSPGSANEIICVDSNGYVTSLAPSAGTCTSFPGTGSTCPT